MARKLFIGAAVLVSLGLVAFWGSRLDWGIVARGDNDFAMIYTGAKLVGSEALYSAPEFERVQELYASVHGDYVLYARLPYYALFLKPLVLLPYRSAYAVFELVNLAALGAFLYWGARHWFTENDSILWLVGVVSVPVLTAFVLGQDVMFVLLICGAAAALVRHDSRFLAGAVLALCSIKPQMFLMLPVMLAVRREWRILAGGAAGGIVLFGISTMAQGWGWLSAYLNLLRNAHDATVYTLPNLRGILMATIGESLALEAVLAAAVAGVVAVASWKIRSFETAFAVAIAGGLLTSHHAYIQDCSLLLSVAALGRTDPLLRYGALMLMTPPFYLLLGAGTVSILLPLGIAMLIVSRAAEEWA